MGLKIFLFIAVLSIARFPLAYSYCKQVGKNPTWVEAPRVEQVTSTSVNVSWEGLLKHKECADSILVKQFKGEDSKAYKLSAVLNVSTNSYLVHDLMPNEAYTYLVIAREEKGLFGVDYNRSPKAVFATNINPTDKPENVVTTTPTIASNVVKLYTINEPHMAKKIKYKGMLHANIVKDLGRQDGESHTSTLREEVLQKLREEALEVGANAVVGIELETNTLSRGVEVVAIGTAVYFEK